MSTEGEAATWFEGSHVAVTMAAARPHGSWERRIMVVRTRQQFCGSEVTNVNCKIMGDYRAACSSLNHGWDEKRCHVGCYQRQTAQLDFGVGVVERELNKRGQVSKRNSL